MAIDPITYIPDASKSALAANPNQTVAQQVGAPPPPAPTVNVNVAQPAPTSTPTSTGSSATPATTSTQQKPLEFNGSVVDLLNSAGTDSSRPARDELAKQFGINGYMGTAAQNKDLAAKYLDFYNKNKATTAPDQNPRQQIQEGTQTQEHPDPQKSFFDSYGALNPAAKMLYDQINSITHPVTTQETLAEMLKQETSAKDLPAGMPGESISDEQLKLMNIKNIMDGTEDDIRTEIQKSGGFATDSQVQSMVSARNKTFVKQAALLQQSLALKQDYVDNLMNFTKLDREAVEKQVDQKLNLTQKLFDMNEKVMSAAQDNYKNIVTAVGYKGLADSFGGDTRGMAQAEKVLGLPPGALQNPVFLENSNAKNAPASVQEYEYAKKNGYHGTFSQYQNEDANRKRSIAAAGAGGLTPYQTNNAVNQIASNFDNEQIVKDFNTISGTLNALKTAGSNPTDDMQRIYAFAKIMDPNSVVREGEYKTVQDYSQALLQRAGISGVRVFDNIGFLTPEARTMMSKTLSNVLTAKQQQYNQVRDEYQRQMNDVMLGKPRTLTDYAVTPTGDQVSQLKDSLAPGQILVSREQKDGRHYYKISPDELWASDIKL